MKQILLFNLKQLNSTLDQLHINQFANYTYSVLFCISDKENKIVLVFCSSKLLMIKRIDWLKTIFFP